MSEHLYFIITSDSGKTFRIPVNKKRFTLVSSFLLLLIFALGVASTFTLSLYNSNRISSRQIADLKQQVEESTQLLTQHQESAEELQRQMDFKVAGLQLAKAKQEASFNEEKEELLANAVTELNERSEHIKSLMKSIGIKIKESFHARKDSGGPFIAKAKKDHDQLLFEADKYLQSIRYTPLGKPVLGQVSSGFGTRLDPLNREGAYHSGLDIRAKRGEKVVATAAGIITQASRNGDYGNVVTIDHGNGYTTNFAHLDRFLTKKGDRVERGQAIGLVGNSGRTTGVHLHYEVCLNNKPINPIKLMTVAGLPLSTPHLSKRN